jgi:4-hydroxybenzoate polyprenyltransferase
MNPPPDHSRRWDWFAWLQLCRAPNVFTAVADVSMGYLVADGGAQRVVLWLALVAISLCMYSAGMILNDVCDAEVDLRERPGRPIPAGRIARTTARRVAIGLLVAAVGLAWGLGLVRNAAAPWWFRPELMATALATSIVLYDCQLKGTLLGPVVMGACRALNVLMGMSVSTDEVWRSSVGPVMIAGSFGIYVMGVTWFARNEVESSPRATLFGGLVLMLSGVALLTLVPSQGAWPRERVLFASPWVWPLLVWLLTAAVWRRAIVALVTTQPLAVQQTIKQALLSLIVLDAAIALVVAGPTYALGLLALLLPSAWIARYLYVT